ncbi:MAG TPA: LysR family transcriptional regulator [Ureibacillus sp.]|nr:LysR family transcriptional regulator [Ureibacillus sp.]
MLDKYTTLVTVAESTSYTEAAKKLYCSQPTITQHIQQLEQHYNCKLVRRHKRSIELTEQGELLVDYARKLIQLEQTVTNRLAMIKGKHQALPIYVSHYFADTFFSMLFNCPAHGTCERCPYELHSLSYKDLRAALLNNDTNFAIMPVYEDDEAIASQFKIDVLFEEELYLVMSKTHKLASRKQLYLRDLEGQQMLLPQSYYLQQLIKKSLEPVQVQYLQMTNFSLIEKAVEQDVGISFVPLVSEQYMNDCLVYKKISGLTILRKNAIISNPENPLSDVALTFYEHIKKQFS